MSTGSLKLLHRCFLSSLKCISVGRFAYWLKVVEVLSCDSFNELEEKISDFLAFDQ